MSLEQTTEVSKLDLKISFTSLLKFALPSIISMVIMGIFSSIDGVFISRFLDVMSLAAANVSMPILTATIAVGAMMAAGGSALVAKQKGEGKTVEARQNFSLIIYFTIIISTIATVIALVFMEPLLGMLGTDDFLLPLSRSYITPITIFIPFIMLGFIFQSFLIADGKPTFAMAISTIGGFSNVVLNFTFLRIFEMGLAGAAYATIIGFSIPSVIGLIYFTFSRKEGLYFVKPTFKFGTITKSMTNGLSEFISLFAVTLTATMMNNIIMDIEGPLGVASVGIMMAVQGLVTSTFMGYAMGIAPLISYNYGKKDNDQLANIYRYSKKIVLACALLSILIATIFAGPLVNIYVSRSTDVYNMAVYGLRIVSMSFIFIAFNMFTSAWFTAFNNGLISGLLSFFRTLVFFAATILILPRIFDMNGVWFALPVAETFAIIMSVYFLKKYKKTYGYGGFETTAKREVEYSN